MSTSRSAGARIERLIAYEEWDRARIVLRRALEHFPEDHWLLTRLALTHFEQHDYDAAFELQRRALQFAPHCPLVLWDTAGTLQMLDRPAEADAIYQRLIRRGVNRLAHGPCGEGLRWARGLIADCWFSARNGAGSPG